MGVFKENFSEVVSQLTFNVDLRLIENYSSRHHDSTRALSFQISRLKVRRKSIASFTRLLSSDEG